MNGTSELKQIFEEIQFEEGAKKEVEKELEEAKSELELAENEKKYFEILIKELVEEYGAEGEKIFYEMYPQEAKEILKS